jgi:hypothetical protein
LHIGIETPLHFTTCRGGELGKSSQKGQPAWGFLIGTISARMEAVQDDFRPPDI